MAELDDELEALRHADPLDRTTVPPSDGADARALFERITMSPDTGTSARTPRWQVAVAAAAVIIAAVAGAIALTSDSETAPTPDTQDATETTVPSSEGGSPISPGGVASCVEQYSLDTLAHRDSAFDGTVESVDGDMITFTVNDWFRGGEGNRTTRSGATTVGGVTSAGPSVSLEPGTRLLVAGDGGFAWGCGFTQPYDPDVAADWAAALEE